VIDSSNETRANYTSFYENKRITYDVKLTGISYITRTHTAQDVGYGSLVLGS